MLPKTCRSILLLSKKNWCACSSHNTAGVRHSQPIHFLKTATQKTMLRATDVLQHCFSPKKPLCSLCNTGRVQSWQHRLLQAVRADTPCPVFAQRQLLQYETHSYKVTPSIGGYEMLTALQ